MTEATTVVFAPAGIEPSDIEPRPLSGFVQLDSLTGTNHELMLRVRVLFCKG